MGKFQTFLITEERNFLGQKVGDVLTAMQDLSNDMENMGSRHVARVSEEIVNRIRKILHGDWTPKQRSFLKNLQKIAVAIQKTVDEKGDIRSLLQAAVQEMQNLSGKIGTPINKMQAPEENPGVEPNMPDTPPDPGAQGQAPMGQPGATGDPMAQGQAPPPGL